LLLTDYKPERRELTNSNEHLLESL
jgi:hypothetical protein